MNRIYNKKHLVLLTLFLGIGVASSILGGDALRERAREAWSARAISECSRITDAGLSWVGTYKRDLRGVAALYRASTDVSEDELLDAVDILATGQSAIPLISVAYARRSGESDYVIDVSTDAYGLLEPGRLLSDIPQGIATVENAWNIPERVAVSPSFSSEGTHGMVLLAQNVTHGESDGVVLTILDLTAFTEGLATLQIPDGIALRLLESSPEDPQAEGTVVVETDRNPTQTVLTSRIQVGYSRIVWWFEWHISDDYDGGPSRQLADVVTGSGIVLTILIAYVIGSLSLQNARVSRRVEERTAEVRQREEYNRLIVDTALDAVITIDSKGIVTGWSPQARAIFGYSLEEVTGQPLSQFIIPTQYRDAHEQGMRRYLETGVEKVLNQRIEITAIDKDEREFPVELAISPLKSGDDYIFSAFVRDITEQKLAQEQIEKSRDDAEEARQAAETANRAKSTFLANISHEFRTPLNAITGFADILGRSLTDPKDKKYLSEITASGATLITLLERILDYSKSETEELVLKESVVDLLDFFAEVQGGFGPRTSAKDLEFRIDLDPGMPSQLVLDAGRFQQLLDGLIDNAIKFTAAGRVVVQVRSIPSEVDSAVDVSLDVQDTGVGIPEDQHADIFKPFTQRQDQSINEYGGTGMGLALVQRIVDAMQGTVSITSQVGVGSTFHVNLPGISIANPATVGDRVSEATTSEELEERVAASPGDVDDSPMDEAARARLPELTDILKDRAGQVTDLASTLTINEIEAFAGEMKVIGEDFSYRPLITWSDALGEKASMFDMDGMAESLASYEQLVSVLPDH